MLKLWDKFKEKCKKAFHKDKKHVDREHFPLDTEKGLTAQQVEQRHDEGLINKAKKHVTKSYFRIIYENVFNFFNILFIVFKKS